MARWIVSDGIFAVLAAATAVRRRGFESASPPPMRAAEVNSRMSLVKTLPRRASTAAFLCLMVAHFECPDIRLSFPQSGSRTRCFAPIPACHTSIPCRASPSRQTQDSFTNDIALDLRGPGVDRFSTTPQETLLQIY